MELKTRFFGDINVDKGKIIKFDNAIPGFPENKNYIIVSDKDEPDSLFCWLQSVDDGMISFVLVDTLKVLPKYNPMVEEDELDILGDFELEDLLIYNIAVIPEDPNKTTINLKAPIIINQKTQKGKQIIVNNEDYPIRYYIIEDMKKIGR